MQKITDILDRWGAGDSSGFSGVVSLRVGGNPVFERAYGFSNRTANIPNTIETRFGVASVGKVLTATAICMLFQEQRLSPQATLSECLDVTPPHFDERITLHHLLTHTSGVPDYLDEGESQDEVSLWHELPVDTLKRPSDYLPLFCHKPMKFIPGTRTDYSNAGYILLGAIIERVTGLDFATCIEQKVFEICDMRDASYSPFDRLADTTAIGYIQNPDGSYRSNRSIIPIIGAPDGGAYMTLRDLLCFWETLLEARLLDEATTRMMLHPHVAHQDAGEGFFFGYGFQVIERPNQARRYFVGGGDVGVNVVSAVYPQQQVLLTILGNSNASIWPFFLELDRLAVSS